MRPWWLRSPPKKNQAIFLCSDGFIVWSCQTSIAWGGARQAINRVGVGNGTDSAALPLEQHVRSQNVTASDESFLQYHQPGETMNREDVVKDPRVFNPEELAASDEMVDQLEQALQGAKRDERESFVLFAIEGFTVEEISHVTDRDAEAIRAEINAARAHLIKKLPANNGLKQKL